jgi:stearoyl-CoA desaturase (delta-9 desaturase)
LGKNDLYWPSIILVGGYHLSLLITLPIYFLTKLPSWGLLLTTFVLVWFTGTGISAGYHRYFSHKSFKTNKLVELVLLFFGTLAVEGSALKWSFDHRLHHTHVDKERDPYNVMKGFWHAHILWIFRRGEEIDQKIVPDLYKNKLVMFQHNFYFPLFLLTNIGVMLLVGFAFKDYFGAIVFATLLRIFLLHHLTWFINSAAHYWGVQSYSKEHSAMDNYILCFLTFGEGYHNYHHTFASDYRNGIKWYHFDPTKWLVWSLEKIGMAEGLIRVNNYAIKKKLVQADKNQVLDKIKRTAYLNKEALAKKVNELSESISTKISEIREMKAAYIQAKREKQNRLAIKAKIKTHKKLLKQEWKTWCRLVSKIMKLKTNLA